VYRQEGCCLAAGKLLFSDRKAAVERQETCWSKRQETCCLKTGNKLFKVCSWEKKEKKKEKKLITG